MPCLLVWRNFVNEHLLARLTENLNPNCYWFRISLCTQEEGREESAFLMLHSTERNNVFIQAFTLQAMTPTSLPAPPITRHALTAMSFLVVPRLQSVLSKLESQQKPRANCSDRFLA